MVIAVMGNSSVGAKIARQFDEATEIETARFPTHANREYTYTLWVVEGFRDY